MLQAHEEAGVLRVGGMQMMIFLEKANADPHEPKRVEGLGEKRLLSAVKGLGENKGLLLSLKGLGRKDYC